mgnify:CR=1 FL=1
MPRALSNRGVMVLGGRRCSIVGTVSMDQVTLDVTDAGEVAAGQVAMFFGEHEGVSQTAEAVAEAVDTIAYEVVCRVGVAVPRIEVPGGARTS